MRLIRVNLRIIGLSRSCCTRATRGAHEVTEGARDVIRPVARMSLLGAIGVSERGEALRAKLDTLVTVAL